MSRLSWQAYSNDLVELFPGRFNLPRAIWHRRVVAYLLVYRHSIEILKSQAIIIYRSSSDSSCQRKVGFFFNIRCEYTSRLMTRFRNSILSNRLEYLLPLRLSHFYDGGSFMLSGCIYKMAKMATLSSCIPYTSSLGGSIIDGIVRLLFPRFKLFSLPRKVSDFYLRTHLIFPT